MPRREAANTAGDGTPCFEAGPERHRRSVQTPPDAPCGALDRARRRTAASRHGSGLGRIVASTPRPEPLHARGSTQDVRRSRGVHRCFLRREHRPPPTTSMDPSNASSTTFDRDSCGGGSIASILIRSGPGIRPHAPCLGGSARRQLPPWHRYRVELAPHVPALGSGIKDRHGHELGFPAALRRSPSTGDRAASSGSSPDSKHDPHRRRAP